MKWSEKQQQVIKTHGCNMLVAAAAGSGKTAVLVQRIIEMLTDPQNPVPIDRLLVVTFTNAAAAEMRDRIGRAIEERLMQDPDNAFLKKQKTYLPKASITTIHSFCLGLIRDHFSLLEIDPAFRLGDEAELKLIKADVITDVMEGFYASGNAAFKRFVDAYGSKSSDSNLENLVLSLYNYAIGSPNPDFFMDQCVRAYICDRDAMGSHPVIEFFKDQIHQTADKCLYELESLKNFCETENMTDYLIPAVCSDMEMIRRFKETDDFDDLCSIKTNWKRMPTLKGANKLEGSDKILYEKNKKIFQNRRDAVKEDMKKSIELFLSLRKEDIADQMTFMRPHVEVLTGLLRAFMDAYERAKEDRNLLDFDDLQHLALKLLVRFEVTEDHRLLMRPTELADRLSENFAEVICDEYQDSNQVQETLLEVLSGSRQGRYNRFMVGDVKQSIYRFRQADAAIFMEKYHAYRPGEEQDHAIRIDLHQNFRSRDHVLEAINYFFRHLMREELGGIEYDDAAALHPGATYPEVVGTHVSDSTEILLVDYDKEVAENEEIDETSYELEARMIAGKIRRLTSESEGLDVYDKNTDSYHRAGYNDIVILLRSPKSVADAFVDVLGQEGIPAQAELSTGFLQAREIRVMTALLQVIDNSRQDIPLATVLLAPFAGLSDEDLALIRSAERKGALIDACKAYPPEAEGGEKLHRFLAELNIYREWAGFLPLDELIRRLYEKTGYYEYVQAMPYGKRRRANLDLLVEKAAAYQAGSYQGLFDFVRFLQQLEDNEVDFGEAAVQADDKGRVRIISTHKSKGLEYPIVFLSGLGKQFNMSDTRGTIFHQSLGIGMDVINPDNRKKMSSAYKTFMAHREKTDTLAEELRILYVAMTRAREKLIMTGVVKDLEKKMETWSSSFGREQEVPVFALTRATCYLDWIMPCLLRTSVFADYLERHHLSQDCMIDPQMTLFKAEVHRLESLTMQVVEETASKVVRKEELLLDPDPETETGKALSQMTEWQYEKQPLLGLKSKYSVSELKKAAFEGDADEAHVQLLFDSQVSEEEEEALPAFMKAEEELQDTAPYTGALRGTAYHRALELVDFAAAPEKEDLDWLEKQLIQMLASGKLDQPQYDCIRKKDLAQMIWSDLGKKMQEADRQGLLKREAQFVMGVPASMIREDSDSQELVIVQGIIDAYYEKNGQLTVIDYKTDRVSYTDGEAELKRRYVKQLDYYQYALEKITGKKVDRRQIYAFALGRAFDL